MTSQIEMSMDPYREFAESRIAALIRENEHLREMVVAAKKIIISSGAEKTKEEPTESLVEMHKLRRDIAKAEANSVCYRWCEALRKAWYGYSKCRIAANIVTVYELLASESPIAEFSAQVRRSLLMPRADDPYVVSLACPAFRHAGRIALCAIRGEDQSFPFMSETVMALSSQWQIVDSTLQSALRVCAPADSDRIEAVARGETESPVTFRILPVSLTDESRALLRLCDVSVPVQGLLTVNSAGNAFYRTYCSGDPESRLVRTCAVLYSSGFLEVPLPPPSSLSPSGPHVDEVALIKRPIALSTSEHAHDGISCALCCCQEASAPARVGFAKLKFCTWFRSALRLLLPEENRIDISFRAAKKRGLPRITLDIRHASALPCSAELACKIIAPSAEFRALGQYDAVVVAHVDTCVLFVRVEYGSELPVVSAEKIALIAYLCAQQAFLSFPHREELSPAVYFSRDSSIKTYFASCASAFPVCPVRLRRSFVRARISNESVATTFIFSTHEQYIREEVRATHPYPH